MKVMFAVAFAIVEVDLVALVVISRKLLVDQMISS